MASAEYSAEPAAVKARFDRACAEIRAKANERYNSANYLASYARSKGLDVTVARVAKNLQLFERWYCGLTRTGHLMNATGVKFKTSDDTKEGS